MKNPQYFDFMALYEPIHWAEQMALFVIICFLVYIWIKLFLYFDK